jgi:AraC-like DNA-binding protein
VLASALKHLCLSEQALWQASCREQRVNTTSNDTRIEWAIAHIQRNVDKPMGTPALAARLQLSPPHFRRLFWMEMGIGPAQYVRRLRLRRARLLLERTFLSVELVMALVGYADAGLFERDFRCLHGMAPATLGNRRAAAPLRASRPDASALGEIPLKFGAPAHCGFRRVLTPAWPNPRTDLEIDQIGDLPRDDAIASSRSADGGPHILRHR